MEPFNCGGARCKEAEATAGEIGWPLTIIEIVRKLIEPSIQQARGDLDFGGKILDMIIKIAQ